MISFPYCVGALKALELHECNNVEELVLLLYKVAQDELYESDIGPRADNLEDALPLIRQLIQMFPHPKYSGEYKQKLLQREREARNCYAE